MKKRTYQIVKTKSHYTHPLNEFHIIAADQNFILLCSAVIFWAVMSALTAYKHKYICNDPLTLIFIGQMSESH